MKKQFFRVKQLADQRFLRAEKTEVLSDDLQDAEKKVDFIKTACCSAGKKIGAPSSGHDPSVKEKRLKKNAEYALGTSLLECATGEDDLLRQVVTDCGKLQICLANTVVDHEMRVESLVVDPLLNVCDTDYPNILKQKKALSKLILDMDSAKTRYQQALKHSGSAGGSKIDSIKDELEEAEGKVEQCRDALACEMLQLISREAELSSVILEYARLQRIHHVAAIAILDGFIPDMENHIRESSMKPVFGTPLDEHLRVTGRKIAYPIELCVCGLLELGIAEEGLFRVAPGSSKLKRMKLSLDANYLQFETALQFRDPHVFAGVLKSYLRELPEPLLTHKLYHQWMDAAGILTTGNQKDGIAALTKVLQCLPQANFDNLHYLIKFLSFLASNKQSNKMTPQNIAIVIAPNLIWSPNDDCNNIGMNMNVASLHSIIVDSLVTNFDKFFRGDVDFYVTLSRDIAFLNGYGDVPTENSGANMKRTQSNDSLSDHNSPPHGSPKPAVRSRKQKSTAPTPPGHKDREDKSSSDEKTKRNSVHKEEKKSREIDEKKSREVEEKKSREVDDKTKVREVEEKKVSSKKPEHRREDAETQTTPPRTISSNTEEPKSLPSVPVDQVAFEAYHPSERNLQRTESAMLDKRTSKSGEDLRRVKISQELTYATLDRKKPPRPTPAPRISLELGHLPPIESKPAIPERPAALQRPFSSSFRINRPTTDSSTEGEGRTTERAHMYSVDKQQVAIVHVTNDKVPSDKKPERERRESGEKPEKPRKPESLVSQTGHQRAASEGSIIDAGMTAERRPPRPTPPPPPISSPTKKDSTDL